MKIDDDENKATLLVVCLPPSYKHFKEILLYNNKKILSYEDVKYNFLPKKNMTLKYILLIRRGE